MIEEPANSLDGGPSACPFVAFEDDRDHRSDAPDYRHRCFAATEPEPRAFPHQERYCLSDGFAACPIFLDWARQEAAGVKPAATAAAAASLFEEDGVDPSNGPAFLASRLRATSVAGVSDGAAGGVAAGAAAAGAAAAGANAASKRTNDAGAGLWSYDSETKRNPGPAAPPPPSSLAVPAVAMARRGPTHPGWENPPRLESFPRLRSRDDRRANQPLLVVAVFVSAIMVALVAYPVIFSGHSGTPIASGSPGLLGSGLIVPSASPSDAASPSPSFVMQRYTVKRNDILVNIAGTYNLQLWEILKANPQLQGNPDHIEINQVLNIPPAGYYGTQPPATPAATPPAP